MGIFQSKTRLIFLAIVIVLLILTSSFVYLEVYFILIQLPPNGFNPPGLDVVNLFLERDEIAIGSITRVIVRKTLKNINY